MTARNCFAIVSTIDKTRINNQIKAPEVQVIDNAGENRGAMKIADALALAKGAGSDLIEIAPHAQPPVVRIMNYDKYRYQQEKKEKERRAQQKGHEMKQVQISVREARHDLERKAQTVNKFLAEGRRVEILLTLRGREKANKDWARQKLNEFLQIITPNHKVALEPRYMGRGFTTHVISH